MGVWQRIGVFLEMIKFEHTVFALPFALTGAMLAAGGLPTLRQLVFIVAAAVCARTAAMSFNRWADARYDALNPRTSQRAIPTGLVSESFALGATILCSLGFVLCAYALNWLAFVLSPVALLVLLGYSYTKRFTSLSHFVLGLALGIAPAGAWIAVKGNLGWPAVLLSLAVLSWVAGFDLIYACQDVEFDKRYGLYSVPARFGVQKALRLSAFLHSFTVVLLASVGIVAGLGWLYFLGVACVVGLLWYEHHLVHPEDLSRLDIAFFTANSWVGMIVLAFTAADLFV
ncbi:MAG: putative 4-hydroxybenzoate polyprenyltransferase [Candidatus Sumerlaeaceae bacterium]|nr:putative 4-hydroxybenzoate polyprenyltransferase [Candidatus Sumerlaeaceae bacterium]